MTDEDDRLDLSAWEAPEPPADLADLVIARVGGGTTTMVGSVPDEAPAPPRRRSWLIAGVAAATLAAAAGVMLVARGTHREAPSSGNVIADQARSLSLDNVQANLDPGAQVTWRRKGGALHVEQRAGTVAWRVSGKEPLVIDAGATVASVEATGASLRVEVKLNQTDARVIGGAALTAAAVALVTVVVYEGRVKVSGSHDQPTVIVEPGSTYTVTPPKTQLVEAPVVGVAVDPDPRTTELPTPADLRIPAGESATIHVAEAPVAIQLDMWGQCEVYVDDTLQTDTTITLDVGVHPYRLDCKMAYSDDTVARVEAQAQPGKTGTFTVVRDDATDAISEDGPVLRIDKVEWAGARTLVRGVTLESATLSTRSIDVPVLDGHFLASMPSDSVMSLRFVHTVRGVHYFVRRAPTTVASAPRTATVCDAVKLRDQGNDRVNQGQHAAALALFERALACKPGDAALTRMTFTSACNALNEAKAKQYWAKLSDDDQKSLGQVCGRNKVAYQTAPAGCDADALKEKGMTNINTGQHAAALAQFEASLRCKPDPYVLQLAFMEACASSNAAKANLYYPRLTKDQREKFRQICIRQKPPVKLVDIDGFDGENKPGYLRVNSKPEAKILIDGVDTGQVTPISGKELELPPGKHKVTFVIGEDRFTYPVVIHPGKTETMTKDLQ